MAFQTIDNGVIVKLPLSKYRELKASNQLVNTEAHIIDDIHNYIDNVVRKNKVIPAGNYIFLSSSPIDLTGLPLDTTLMTMKGQNGVIINLFLAYENNKYVIKATDPTFAYMEVLANGSSINSVQALKEYLEINTNGYGKFAVISYLHPQFQNIIDNMIKINCKC